MTALFNSQHYKPEMSTTEPAPGRFGWKIRGCQSSTARKTCLAGVPSIWAAVVPLGEPIPSAGVATICHWVPFWCRSEIPRPRAHFDSWKFRGRFSSPDFLRPASPFFFSEILKKILFFGLSSAPEPDYFRFLGDLVPFGSVASFENIF